MDPDLVPTGAPSGYTAFRFPGGEEHIKLDPAIEWKEVKIVQRIRSSSALMQILLATDALRRVSCQRISLSIPYFPYQQQDRVMTPGEPLSIKVIADLVNQCGFLRVQIYDPHSDVTPALLNNCVIMDNAEFILWTLALLPPQTGEPVLVAPDAGAQKKLANLCRRIGFTGAVAVGHKHRELATGKILRQSIVHDIDLKGRTCLIVDDICVGGRTFVELATILRQAGATSIHLAVSHGVFSNGIAPESFPGIDAVYCTNSYQTLPNDDSPFIQQWNIPL